MRQEFDKRGYDYSIVGDKKSLAFDRKVRLEGGKFVVIEQCEGGSVIFC
jgi:hypothetical protein